MGLSTLNDDGQVVAEHRRLGPDAPALLAWLTALLGPVTVAMEGSPWLKWILIEIVESLKLAPGPVGQQYQKLLRAKGKAKAKATVAGVRKRCCYLSWCLKEEWSYDQWLRQHGRLEVRPVQPLGSAA